jgi:soluble lytic murein transglycosylase-like protein
MKFSSTGGRLAAATLAICLGISAPVGADPHGHSSKTPKIVAQKAQEVRPLAESRQSREIRPPRGLATYKMIIARHAKAQGVPFDLARAVVWHESRYKVNAIGRAGERGLMQIKPATARGLGYRGDASGLHDPEVNIQYGMKYLGKAYQLASGDLCQTVLLYNAGLGAKHMTPNASKYCAKVKKYLRIPEPVPMNMP